jgi:hypothetical protein
VIGWDMPAGLKMVHSLEMQEYDIGDNPGGILYALPVV